MSRFKANAAANAAAAEKILTDCGFEKATVQAFARAAAAGDVDSLKRQFFVRDLRPLPGSEELAPAYSCGLFPRDPVPTRTPGGAVISAEQLLHRVSEQNSLLREFGDGARAAAPRLFEPIL